jgi:hypothetical protein
MSLRGLREEPGNAYMNRLLVIMQLPQPDLSPHVKLQNSVAHK